MLSYEDFLEIFYFFPGWLGNLATRLLGHCVTSLERLLSICTAPEMILSGSIWGSFQGWGSFRGRDHFGGCTDRELMRSRLEVSRFAQYENFYMPISEGFIHRGLITPSEICIILQFPTKAESTNLLFMKIFPGSKHSYLNVDLLQNLFLGTCSLI